MLANTIKNINVSKHNQEHVCQQTQSRTYMSANTIKNMNSLEYVYCKIILHVYKQTRVITNINFN